MRRQERLLVVVQEHVSTRVMLPRLRRLLRHQTRNNY
jgi:hypothetical protein